MHTNANPMKTRQLYSICPHGTLTRQKKRRQEAGVRERVRGVKLSLAPLILPFDRRTLHSLCGSHVTKMVTYSARRA